MQHRFDNHAETTAPVLRPIPGYRAIIDPTPGTIAGPMAAADVLELAVSEPLPGHVVPAPARVPAFTPRAGLTGVIPGITLPPIAVLPPLPLGSQRLSLDQYRQLFALALETPELAWPPGYDIGLARNAHNTNTPDEMAEALAGNYDYLEGDVRIDRHGTVIMAHDKGDARGMSLEEWLAIGGAAGRGLKLDFKEANAIMPALAAVHRHGIPDERLNINITVYGSRDANVTVAMLRTIRRMFPRAIINLSVSVNGYTREVLTHMARMARVVGQPAMFPLRLDLVSPTVIAALRPYGKVAIWNSPEIYSPTDIDAERARLRAMSVNGTIDLRTADKFSSVTGPLLRASISLFGWTATLQALRGLAALKRLVG